MKIATSTQIKAKQFAIENGWDFTCIEATAATGVSDEDRKRLAGSGLTPRSLLAWCKWQVRKAVH